MNMNKKAMLRVLKGAPLSMLISLFIFGESDQRDLVVSTGYGRETVANALLVLESYELVERPHYRKWQIKGGQMSLFEGEDISYPQVIHRNAESLISGHSEAESLNSGLSALVSSSSNNQLTKEEDQPPNKEILDVCKELGIVGAKRQLLARLDHVIKAGPAYVRAHVDTADNLGLAIWRMEDGWKEPEKKVEWWKREEFKDSIRR